MRSFALYKPFRFFFFMGVIPFLVSIALVVRWFYLQVFTDDAASRVPSLVAASVFIVITTQIWVVGFLADLLSVNRKVVATIRLDQRRRELADSGAALP